MTAAERAAREGWGWPPLRSGQPHPSRPWTNDDDRTFHAMIRGLSNPMICGLSNLMLTHQSHALNGQALTHSFTEANEGLTGWVRRICEAAASAYVPRRSGVMIGSHYS